MAILDEGNGVKRVVFDRTVYAYFISDSRGGEGTAFYSNDKDEMQVGIVCRKPGEAIKGHTHKTVDKRIKHISEFLLVRDGECTIRISDDYSKNVASFPMKKGDSVLLLYGHHAIYPLGESGFKLLEIKQGPYEGEQHDTSK